MTDRKPPDSAKAKRKPAKRGARGGTLDNDKITVRVTKAQRARIERFADAGGLTPASYGRVSMLQNLAGVRTVPKPPIDRAAVERLLVNGSRMGGNLYQLVRDNNFGGVVLEQEAAEMLQELRGYLDDIRMMLGRKPMNAPPLGSDPKTKPE